MENRFWNEASSDICSFIRRVLHVNRRAIKFTIG